MPHDLRSLKGVFLNSAESFHMNCTKGTPFGLVFAQYVAA